MIPVYHLSSGSWLSAVDLSLNHPKEQHVDRSAGSAPEPERSHKRSAARDRLFDLRVSAGHPQECFSSVMQDPNIIAARTSLAQALNLVQQAIGAMGAGDDAAVKQLVAAARLASGEASEASHHFMRDNAANDGVQKV